MHYSQFFNIFFQIFVKEHASVHACNVCTLAPAKAKERVLFDIPKDSKKG